MSAITTKDFRQAVVAAVEKRSPIYAQAFALHIRWEVKPCDSDSDSDGPGGTEAGFNNFKSFLRCFGLPPPERFVIPLEVPQVNWVVRKKFRSVLEAAAAAAEKNNGRSIVFIHYAGHAKLDEERDAELIFGSWSGGIFPETVFFQGLVGPRVDFPTNIPVDVVFLFDCYYPDYLATREVAGPDCRVVEVLAAMDIKSPGAVGEVSFTGKAARKMASLKKKGQRSVELAELISMLREESRSKLPFQFLKMGTSSVRLRLGHSTIHDSVPPPIIGSKLRAVLNITLLDNFSKEELHGFIRWIHSLNPTVGITLEGIYKFKHKISLESDSCRKSPAYSIILQVPYALYTKLRGIPGIELICETMEDDLLKGLSAPGEDLGRTKKMLSNLSINLEDGEVKRP
jgi:hypothetical protein